MPEYFSLSWSYYPSILIIAILANCVVLVIALPTCHIQSSYTQNNRTLWKTHLNRTTKLHTTDRSIIQSNNNQSSDSAHLKTPTRYSSRDAASIIKNSSAEDGLLIITSDASGRGGGSKHDGLAAVLRIRHGVSKMPCQDVANHDKKVDLLDTITRRRAPTQKSSNEVAAISIGMKRAMQIVPLSWRKKVLIVSDSETALNFYCGDDNSSRGGDDSHQKILNRLMMESCNGVFFTKTRSSSRGIGMVSFAANKGEDNKITSWDGIGFVDHDAADYLSSATRSVPNSKHEMNYDEVLDIENLPFRAVCPLRSEDIEWLKKSDESVQTSSDSMRKSGRKYWNKINVRGSDARNEQRKRNESKRKMVMEMLGMGNTDRLQ